MKKEVFLKKKSFPFAVAFLVTAILFGCIGLFSDVVYGLNDDLMIQSILSGGLNGTPGGLAVYLSVPLSSVLAMLYRIFPQLPWLGVLLAGCYILCFFLILFTVLKKVQKAGGGAGCVVGACVLVCAIFGGFLLGQYLLIHYTVTAAVVGGTAIFLFRMAEDDGPDEPGREEDDGAKRVEWKRIVGNTGLPVALLWLCYLIRTKVFFMVIPFLAVVGLFRMIRTKRLIRYLIPLGCLFAGILFFWLLGKIGYGSAAWKEYLEYNDARTELYDYALIWEGEEASEYYAKQGYPPEEMAIYRAYNVLLNENLSAEDFRTIASYADLLPDRQRSFAKKLQDGFWLYRHRIFSREVDFPMNYFVFALYFVILALVFVGRDFWAVSEVLFLGAVRSVLWVYLLMEGRYPERVIISLYLAEFLVLLGILWNTVRQMKSYRKPGAIFAVLSCAALAVGALCFLLPEALENRRDQCELNRAEGQIYDYMSAHPEQKYLLDVYATVYCTEYVFKGYDNEVENYLLLGGWSAGAPYVADKLALWGYDSAFDALKRGEDVCLVLKKGAGMRPDELRQYYRLRTGEDMVLVCVDSVNTDRGVFEIYQKK